MPRKSLRLLTSGFVLLGLVLLGAGFIGFVQAARTLEKTDFLHFGELDGAVVLTGGQARIAEGVEVLASGRVRRLLITGVNQSTRGNELAHSVPLYRDYMECCIDLGYSAQNTAGNAEETRRWARAHNFQSLVIVTSAYHMPRAIAEMHHALPGTVLVPHVVGSDEPKTSDPFASAEDLRLYLAEYIKFLIAQARFLFSPAPELSSNGATKAADCAECRLYLSERIGRGIL